jgi:hypothetical protein
MKRYPHVIGLWFLAFGAGIVLVFFVLYVLPTTQNLTGAVISRDRIVEGYEFRIGESLPHGSFITIPTDTHAIVTCPNENPPQGYRWASPNDYSFAGFKAYEFSQNFTAEQDPENPQWPGQRAGYYGRPTTLQTFKPGRTYYIFGGTYGHIFGCALPMNTIQSSSASSSTSESSACAATSISTESASLPSQKAGAASVYDANRKKIYIFGGLTRDIFEFDPIAGTVALLETKLPYPLTRASAVFDPIHDKAYIFGGKSDSTAKKRDEILAFDPESNHVDIVGKLSLPLADTAAVWDTARSKAYIFGGFDDEDNPRRNFDTFDPLKGVELTGLSLPYEVADATAAIDPRTGISYVLSGYKLNATYPTTSVIFFDPLHSTLDWQGGGYPDVASFRGASAAWNPVLQRIVVVGGILNSSTRLDSIRLFNPDNVSYTALSEHLNGAPYQGSLAWDSDTSSMYVIGGTNVTFNMTQIKKITTSSVACPASSASSTSSSSSTSQSSSQANPTVYSIGEDGWIYKNYADRIAFAGSHASHLTIDQDHKLLLWYNDTITTADDEGIFAVDPFGTCVSKISNSLTPSGAMLYNRSSGKILYQIGNQINPLSIDGSAGTYFDLGSVSKTLVGMDTGSQRLIVLDNANPFAIRAVANDLSSSLQIINQNAPHSTPLSPIMDTRTGVMYWLSNGGTSIWKYDPNAQSNPTNITPSATNGVQFAAIRFDATTGRIFLKNFTYGASSMNMDGSDFVTGLPLEEFTKRLNAAYDMESTLMESAQTSSVARTCLLFSLSSSSSHSSASSSSTPEHVFGVSSDRLTINVSTDGGQARDILHTTTPIQSIAIDPQGNGVYWKDADGSFVGFSWVNGIGECHSTLVTNTGDTTFLQEQATILIDGITGKIFWQSPLVHGSFHVSNLDGSNVQTIGPFRETNGNYKQVSLVAIDVQRRKIYVSINSAADNLYSFNLDDIGAPPAIVLQGNYSNPSTTRYNDIQLDTKTGDLFYVRVSGPTNVMRSVYTLSNNQQIFIAPDDQVVLDEMARRIYTLSDGSSHALSIPIDPLPPEPTVSPALISIGEFEAHKNKWYYHGNIVLPPSLASCPHP